MEIASLVTSGFAFLLGFLSLVFSISGLKEARRARLKLSKRLSAYPPADVLLEDLEAQSEQLKTMSSEMSRLLTREAAEKIVANINRLTEDFVATKEFVDTVRQSQALRETLLSPPNE
jgi:hypothetical protein